MVTGTPLARLPSSAFSFSPEQVRDAADVFYLTPLAEQHAESGLWFSAQPLPAIIIEHILNRLRLLPDFHPQTKPVEMNSSASVQIQ